MVPQPPLPPNGVPIGSPRTKVVQVIKYVVVLLGPVGGQDVQLNDVDTKGRFDMLVVEKGLDAVDEGEHNVDEVGQRVAVVP